KDEESIARLNLALGGKYMNLHAYLPAIETLSRALNSGQLRPKQRLVALSAIAKSYLAVNQSQQVIDLIEPLVTDLEKVSDVESCELLHLYGTAVANLDSIAGEKIFKKVYRGLDALGKLNTEAGFTNSLNLLTIKVNKLYNSTKYIQQCKSWLLYVEQEFGKSFPGYPLMVSNLSQCETQKGNHIKAVNIAENAVELASFHLGVLSPTTLDLQLKYINCLKAAGRPNFANYVADIVLADIESHSDKLWFAQSSIKEFALKLNAISTGGKSPFHNKEGYDDTPTIPGHEFNIHSPLAPLPKHPSVIECDQTPPPEGAIVLLDGDLSNFDNQNWKLDENNVLTCVGGGDIRSLQKFGDCQVHIEFFIPGAEQLGQNNGNSGVFLMDNYEVQVLNSYDSLSYADGICGAIYGQFPPSLNASLPAGKWQSFDIFFTRPRFNLDGSFKSPPTISVRHNGVPIHLERKLYGPTRWRELPTPTAHPDRLPLRLQDHGSQVKYRNIWIRDFEIDN
ncbi:MAG: DUF1080 domain-containing protein, partial [Planctomycetota bacterium]|nr:DUF1080 domain-containing protein [Planctomycetota bacterium]